MANFFDQFVDEPSDNFFDKYVDNASPASPPGASARRSGFAAALDTTAEMAEQVGRHTVRGLTDIGAAAVAPVSEFVERAGRGWTEVGAAVAGARNPNAAALFAQEEVDRSNAQIAEAKARLQDIPETDTETRDRIDAVIAAEEKKIAAYLPLVDIAEGPLKPVAQPSRERTAAEIAQADLTGGNIVRPVRRGLLRSGSSLPIGMAIADATAFDDAKLSEQQLIREAAKQATGLDQLPDGDYSSPEKAANTISSMGFSPDRPVLFRELLERRKTNAAAAAADPEGYKTRFLQNREAGETLYDRAMAIPMSPESEFMKKEFAKDTTLGGSISAILRNPKEAAAFLIEVGLESAPQAAVAGGVSLLTRSPAAGALAMGAGVTAQEFGSSVSEFLAENGVKIKTEADAIALLNNTDLLRAAGERGMTRAVVIAAFEAMGQGIAARRLLNSPVGEALVQTVVQGFFGGSGEAAAMRASGQEFNAQEILIEALAETVTAPLDVGAAALAGKRGGAVDAQTKAAGTPPSIPPAPDYSNSPLLTETDKAQPIADVIGEGKEIIEDLLDPNVPEGVQQGDAPLSTLYDAPTAPEVQTTVTTNNPARLREVMDEVGRTSERAPAAPAPITTPEAPQDAPTLDPVDLGQNAAPEAVTAPQQPQVAPVAPRQPRPPEEDEIVPEIPQASAEPVVAPAETPEAAPAPQGDVRILANEELTSIETDAATFQYKSNADAEGVTDRLADVKTWDNTRAGSALVYEDAQGKRTIADGHQRLALAKKLRAQGQDVSLPVVIRRETDGHTPRSVMIEAALANIAQSPVKGNADPQMVVDAAKVMRADPDLTVESMNLPANSALVRDATAVRSLSDDAFGMLVNEKATVRNAVAVATAVPDQAAHADILGLLEKLPIKNQFEAEQVARQAAADTQVETQDSLFGPEDVTQSLYLERARVMDVAIKRLRKDKATFNTLVQRGGTISEAGNTLDQDANKRKVQESALVQEYLTRQANSKGAISDALTEAAKAVKGGAEIGQAVTGVIDSVRGSIKGDSQAGQGANGNRRVDEQAGAGTEGQPEVSQQAYPTAPRSEWYGDANFANTGGQMVTMTPDQFLDQVRPLDIDESSRDNIDDLKRHIQSGRTLDPLQISAKGKEDGRHRAVAAKELGIKEIPVLIWPKSSGLTTETTPEGEQTVIPGTRDDQGSDTARDKAEADARAKQSKKGTTTPQDNAGPLFGDEGGTQGGLFDEGAKPATTPDTSVIGTGKDPLRKSGDWQDADIVAEAEDGTEIDVSAKVATTSLFKRLAKAKRLLACVNS